ncbi:MAG: 4-hydroxyphenylpyruvate dioxygenase [Phycisphaerales bacterium]|nr:4-hydroxyphenylpyruvate dioxygenase [Phycisphaerales bacterium]
MKPTQKDSNFLPIEATDYVEFYVGNAKQSAYYFCNAWGMMPYAYCGPETGVRDRVSYVVKQDKIVLVLTSSLVNGNDIAKHVAKHGDGVKVLALRVPDATKAWKETTKRGAKSYLKPSTLKSKKEGKVIVSGIQLYGDTVHTFVERKNYSGVFLPNYEVWTAHCIKLQDVGLQVIDHCVANVGWNKMNKWVSFYEKIMGFKNIITFDDNDISTEYTALMSKVMSNGNGYIKFPINEPAKGKKKSQIEEYLDFYYGEGIQHLALSTNNIIETVAQLKSRGVDFLSVPDSYYQSLLQRVGTIDESIESLKKYDILVDRDDEGYLLQIFTKPIGHRPTVFFEIIQRKGAKSFGKGNFKALFEAIEREQAKRGNL